MRTKPPKIVPLHVVARHLGLHPRDLRAAAEAGEIPSLRVGKALMFSMRAVEDALLRRAAGSEVRDEK